MANTDVGGVDIHYEIVGEGHALLLLHGAGTSRAMWEYMVPDLATSFRVITCDLRGHGDSGRGDPTRYSIGLFADDIKGLLDKLGVEKVHFVGYSTGALIAEQFAITYPERLHTLVLGGTPTRVPPFFENTVPFGIRLMKFERLGGLLLRRVPKDRRGHVAKVGTEMYSKAGKEVFSADVKASRAFLEKLPDLTTISVPVLIVSGDKDSFSNGEVMRKLIPRARVAIIEGATHGLTAEKPEAFVKVILDFCREST